jgi:hypothetical protein
VRARRQKWPPSCRDGGGVNVLFSVARAPGFAGVLPFAINHATG